MTISMNIKAFLFFSRVNLFSLAKKGYLPNFFRILLFTTLLLGLFIPSAFATPWVGTDDPYLKASIKALAHGGIIKTPINTYPLMYKNIVSDLNAAKYKNTPQHLKFALQYVKHALKYSKKPSTKGLKIKATSNNDDFQSVGERYQAKGELNVFYENIGDNWAFKTSVNYTNNAANNKNLNFEGSYLATFVGNWVVSLGQQSQWWGPGQDSTLILSNNAIAVPALKFTRHTNEAIDFPVLNWLGPISMTTHFGVQEHNNQTENIRIWGARVNFKPIDSLEIGFSRAAQWGGNGRKTNFRTFWNMLRGNDNTEIDGEITKETEPGNQLGGMDIHWSTSLFEQNLALYGEVIGEDEAGGLPANIMYQLGLETSFGDGEKLGQFFIEYVNTFVDCTVGGHSGVRGNCAYEHGVFIDGYRRYRRSMGSTYDSDSEVLTVGLNQVQSNDTSWYAKLKLLHINKDDSDRGGRSFAHPVSEFAQKRLQIEGGYRFPVMKGLLNIEATLFRSKITRNNETDIDGSLKASWEYHF
jgi:hypothetical protein